MAEPSKADLQMSKRILAAMEPDGPDLPHGEIIARGLAGAREFERKRVSMCVGDEFGELDIRDYILDEAALENTLAQMGTKKAKK